MLRVDQSRTRPDGLPEAVCRVFSREAARLRVLYPEIYARVDALLVDPTREARQYVSVPTGWVIRDCAWCGDDFITLKSRNYQSCTKSCANRYSAFKRKRNLQP